MTKKLIAFWGNLAAITLMSTLSCVIGTAGHTNNSRESNVTPARSTVEAQAPTNGRPAPPAVFLDTTYTRPTGRTIAVAGGASASQNLQAAIDSAAPGDVITLEAGAVFKGNFKLPKKAEQPGWITIRSSAPDASLPPAGTRIQPSASRFLPKIISPDTQPAMRTAAGAHHYRFIAVEFSLASDVTLNYGLVSFGSDQHTSFDELPHDLILDRCFIHGSASADLSRGLALNCASAAVIDSYISDCHGQGFDAQAIASWNGSGPFKIVNNYLEGAGENVLFGGSDPKINSLVASDIEFRRNTCSKPLSWKVDDPSFAGKHWTVKNLFELKNARRVIVEGNIFENNWVDAQSGVAILFTPRNQDGTAPWSVVEDVTFTNNIVRHTSGAINILGTDNEKKSEQTKRIEITNNLFEDVDGKRWGKGDGVFLIITETINVTLDHNTILQSGNLITAYGKPNRGFAFTNNLARHNEYGIFGADMGTGNPALSRFFPEGLFKRNALIGGQKSLYPADNFFPAEVAEVGFAGQSQGDYALSATSQLKQRGTDGKDVGCNLSLIRTAIDSARPAVRSSLQEQKESAQKPESGDMISSGSARRELSKRRAEL
jgi:hypothetical protein